MMSNYDCEIVEMMEGLTIWTDSVSVQVRDDEVALSVQPEAVRSTEAGEPVLIPAADARKVRDLLNVATARGFL
jgi:hypothetical protein